MRRVPLRCRAVPIAIPNRLFPDSTKPNRGKRRASIRRPCMRRRTKLRDKIALITGGDSGIGRVVAVMFAREGADVAIIYLDEKQDAEVTAQAVRAEGKRCLLIAGDVSKRQQAGGAAHRPGIRQA
jgi:short chain dehydrogenase